jgi:hypothetical protein
MSDHHPHSTEHVPATFVFADINGERCSPHRNIGCDGLFLYGPVKKFAT